jgi:hypothetical protein
VHHINQRSIAYPVFERMPCKCGGTKWLIMIEPADNGLLRATRKNNRLCGPNKLQTEHRPDPADHDLRT